VTPAPLPPEPSSSAGPTGSPTPTPVDAELDDGRHFGYIKALAPSSLEFDLAEFYTGADANRAAREDGRIGSSETVDNDYYIRNVSNRMRTLSMADDMVIKVVDWTDCCELVDGEVERFKSAFRTGASDESSDDSYRGPESSYWVFVESGRIVRIEEQYLP
jgi:hypothetical protein